MREARSIVNACFAFAIFLLGYAFFDGLFNPESMRRSGTSPRFLRMEVEEMRPGRSPEKHVMSVPYFLVGNAFRFAALGAFHRELEMQFDSDLDADTFKAVWADLKSNPDGTEVTRNHDGDTLRFRKEGEFVVLQVAKHSYRSSITESDSGSADEMDSEPAGDDANASDTSKAATSPGATPAPKASMPPKAPTPPALLTVSTDDDGAERLTLRMPVRLVEAAIDADRDFDARTLLSELGAVNRGDLIDIRHHNSRHHESHVRVWVE